MITFLIFLRTRFKYQIYNLANVKSNQGKSVDALDISKRCMLLPDQARNIVRNTSQQSIRTVMNTQMSRRYPINDRALGYPRLPHPLFTDTMIAGTVSKRGNNNSQVYGTYFGWTRFFPMKLNSDDHETLPLLFNHDGVPPEMIVDNSKE